MLAILTMRFVFDYEPPKLSHQRNKAPWMTNNQSVCRKLEHCVYNMRWDHNRHAWWIKSNLSLHNKYSRVRRHVGRWAFDLGAFGVHAPKPSLGIVRCCKPS